MAKNPDTTNPSRRTLLAFAAAGAAASPVLAEAAVTGPAAVSAPATGPDAALLALGREFDAVLQVETELRTFGESLPDDAPEQSKISDEWEDAWERVAQLAKSIHALDARTIEGIGVKIAALAFEERSSHLLEMYQAGPELVRIVMPVSLGGAEYGDRNDSFSRCASITRDLARILGRPL